MVFNANNGYNFGLCCEWSGNSPTSQGSSGQRAGGQRAVGNFNFTSRRRAGCDKRPMAGGPAPLPLSPVSPSQICQIYYNQ